MLKLGKLQAHWRKHRGNFLLADWLYFSIRCNSKGESLCFENEKLSLNLRCKNRFVPV